jgi:hypothetical protein
MTTRPGYVWDDVNEEWVKIGQAAVIAPVSYQATEPTSPATGDIWIDSDDEVPGITSSLNYRWRRIATGGETSLSGNDSSGLPLAYNPGYEQVYLNGVLLYRGSDYVATTGNTITGLTALVANDTVEVLSFVTAPIGDTYTQAAADAKFTSQVNNGLVLIKTQTIPSGVSSVTVADAFNANYDAYKVVFSGVTSTAAVGTTLQVGTANSNYYGTYINTAITYGSAAGNVTYANTNNGTAYVTGIISTASGTGASGGTVEIQNPFGARTTTFQHSGSDPRTDGAGLRIGTGYHNSATSYTSLTYLASGTTFTGGRISVYGYNNGA